MSRVKECSELVLGLITTVGTDTQNLISCFRDQFGQFEFTVEELHVSRDILEQFNNKPVPQNEYDRICFYMDLGDFVREKTHDNAILMRGVAAQILAKRGNDFSELKPRE